MKALSLITSIVGLLAAAYYFVIDFNLSGETNHLIYMSLLVVLMMICIVGILINVPLIIRERRKMKMMMYNKFGRKRVSRRLDFNFEI